MDRWSLFVCFLFYLCTAWISAWSDCVQAATDYKALQHSTQQHLTHHKEWETSSSTGVLDTRLRHINIYLLGSGDLIMAQSSPSITILSTLLSDVKCGVVVLWNVEYIIL